MVSLKIILKHPNNPKNRKSGIQEEEAMEKRHRPNKDGGRRSPKRKKTTPTPTPLTNLPPADPITIFSLLLAASLYGNSLHQAMLTNCLKKLHFHFLSESQPDHLLLPLLAIIPSLLHSRDPRVACRAAEIVGAMSLQSLEMNEMIVMDGETVRALVSLLGSSARGVSMAACNSLLDLCATSVGRRRLLECFALERLLLPLLQLQFLCCPKIRQMFLMSGLHLSKILILCQLFMVQLF